MSTLTSFRLSDASARATSLGMPRHRVMAVAFGVLGLATACVLGLTPLAHARYLEDQPTVASELGWQTSLDMSLRTYDDWPLTRPAATPSLDLSLWTHDDWPLTLSEAD